MKTSVDVHNALSEKNIPHEVVPLSRAATSTREMAAVLNLSFSEVVKSVLFVADGEPMLIILSGDKMVCYKKLRKALKVSNLRLATREEVVDFTGYMLGATPPLAHKISLCAVMDANLRTQNVVYTSAGEFNAVLKIRTLDLEKAICARVFDLTGD